MADESVYQVLIDAARTVADQADDSLATVKDHAEREAIFAVIAAFRTFAMIVEQEQDGCE